MAELFVPKIIDQLTDVVCKQIGERVSLEMGVEEEVKNLTFKLTTIKRVLHDAERRKLNENDVEVWLERLEDITYEMEDVLDDWNIKVYKRRKLDQGAQVKVSRMSTLLKKVHSLISSFSSRLKEVFVRSEIALTIKEINDKLDLSLKEANQFNFVFTHGAHVDSNTFTRPMTTSIFDELEVHGREDDKKNLLEHLLSKSMASTSKEVDKNEVKVISIVGAGGSGKTTLAQMLYNDDRVQKHFDLRKWVCVSYPFDQKRIANALLENPGKSNVFVSELETLLQDIKTTFSGKRFLLVLDDVWTENDTEWKPFKDTLKIGAPGSIILVTTRKDTVARVVRTKCTYPLGLMSDSECWLILKNIALSGRSELCERVETIGRKIAGKCKGLPLAAKVMGSLLRMKDTEKEWRGVLNSKIWQMEKASADLFPHFYLSYNELTPQLKRCFSYCALFPKDTKIDVEGLIRLWMAQGYLGSQSLTVHDRLNVIGRDYFKHLAMCSFFQEFIRSQFDENEIIACKMHDIVHDFAQFLTKNECHAFDEVDCQRVETSGGYLCKERVRHLILLGKAKSINSSVVVDIGKVRSLLFNNYGMRLPPQDLCSSMKSVRSLILSGLQELPPEIGSLIHLRCLDVSHNGSLKELPETVCDLHFLESLGVIGCYKLERLPQRIGDLVHLRYLLNDRTEKVKEMPPGIEKLTWLWNLGRFVADGTPLNNLGKLEHLNQLEQLNIIVRGHVDFESAQLEKKINLRILELRFEGEGLDIESIESIEIMEPPPNLQQLFFYGYPRSQLPNWIVEVESLINNLTALCVYDADISSLPALGKLSCLQFLLLDGMWNVKDIGREFYGLPDDDHDNDDFKVVAFPSLRKLSMSYLNNWERWEDISEGDEEKIKNDAVSIMPRIESLTIRGCESLEALPNRLLGKSSSLKRLEVLGCGRRLMEKYPADKKGGDLMKILHIPSVEFEKKIMLKVNINSQKCRTQVLKAVSQLAGIDQVAVDAEKGLVTVIGNADPMRVVNKIRKTGKAVEIISVGSPKKTRSS